MLELSRREALEFVRETNIAVQIFVGVRLADEHSRATRNIRHAHGRQIHMVSLQVPELES